MLSEKDKKERKSLENVTISQWNVANLKIMYILLSRGELNMQPCISGLGTLHEYLMYTSKVMEYAGQFPWKSVLRYDQAFRHKQANGQLCWKDDNQHLVTIHLVSPIHKDSPLTSSNSRGARQATVPICRMYNYKTGCTYGPGGCAYVHKCNVAGCNRQHPAYMHTSATKPE